MAAPSTATATTSMTIHSHPPSSFITGSPEKPKRSRRACPRAPFLSWILLQKERAARREVPRDPAICRRLHPLFVLLALMFFACLGRFLCRFPAILGGAARARPAPELFPVLLRHIDAVMLGCLLDVGEGKLAVLV